MSRNPALAIQTENPTFFRQTQEHIDLLRCFTPCANGFTGNEAVPSTGCKVYHECWMGTVRSRNECGSPLIFDEARNYCNFPSEVSCPLGSEYVGCVESNSPTGYPKENSFTGTFVGCLMLFISQFLLFKTNHLTVCT